MDLTSNPLSVIVTDNLKVSAVLEEDVTVFNLTVGMLTASEFMAEAGYYSGKYGSLSPTTFKEKTVRIINATVFMDPMTGGYTVNQMGITLGGNTTEITSIGAYINGQLYTLNLSGYVSNNNWTNYIYNFGSGENTVMNYFSSNNGKAVTVTLK
ncbi:hypothetical protein [Phascolarctobacterium faecium]|uniref:hypothetical protein n=1 Tax=Phascolarctobacterium faecium TaxID=33025 RepID=UPI0020460BF9|nr:MAG TPA: hypothetical protein [Caudoviricetes sp.]